MQVVGFNTGRLYQSDGQLISVSLNEKKDGVLFNDHSRGIGGRLNVMHQSSIILLLTKMEEGYTPRQYELGDLAHNVMMYYDRGQYIYDSAADRVKAASWPKIQL